MKSCWCAPVLMLLMSAALHSQTRPYNNSADDVELYGTVSGLAPRAGCTVELSSVNSYANPQQSTCNGDGSFQFMDVPRGVYDLVVRAGTREYSKEVRLNFPREVVEIRIPTPAQAKGNTISVTEMRVPENARKEFEKADEALSENKLAKANEHVRKALAIAPQYARALTMKAVLMIAQGDLASALQNADNSAQIEPMLPMTQFVRAAVLNRMGRPKEAQAAAEQGLRLENAWQGHYELAQALLAQKEFQRALVEINRAAASAPPEFAELTLLRVSALLHVNDAASARSVLLVFLKERPGDARAERLLSVANDRISGARPGAENSLSESSAPAPSVR